MAKMKVYVLIADRGSIWAVSENRDVLDEIQRQRDGEWDGCDGTTELKVSEYSVLTSTEIKCRFKEVFCKHAWQVNRYGYYKCKICDLEYGNSKYVKHDDLPRIGITRRNEK